MITAANTNSIPQGVAIQTLKLKIGYSALLQHIFGPAKDRQSTIDHNLEQRKH